MKYKVGNTFIFHSSVIFDSSAYTTGRVYTISKCQYNNNMYEISSDRGSRWVSDKILDTLYNLSNSTPKSRVLKDYSPTKLKGEP